MSRRGIGLSRFKVTVRDNTAFGSIISIVSVLCSRAATFTMLKSLIIIEPVAHTMIEGS